MIVYILAVLVVLLAALMAFGIAALLHLQGAAYAIFVMVLLLIGIGAAVAIVVMHRRSKRQEEEGGAATGGEAGDIDLLLNDVNRKLRNSQHGVKTLDELPLVYLLGESGSAKTTTVTQSGMEAELVAGSASHGAEQAPTETLNLWFTGAAALLEVGTTIRGTRRGWRGPSSVPARGLTALRLDAARLRVPQSSA